MDSKVTEKTVFKILGILYLLTFPHKSLTGFIILSAFFEGDGLGIAY